MTFTKDELVQACVYAFLLGRREGATEDEIHKACQATLEVVGKMRELQKMEEPLN